MKFIANLLLIFLLVILQISLMPKFIIFHSYPNLIFLVMMILIFLGKFREAGWWAIFGGILLDFNSQTPFGFYSLSLIFIFLIFSILTFKFFSNPTILIISIFLILGSLILDLGFLILTKMYILIIFDSIYNLISGLLLYYIIRNYFKPKELLIE